MPEQDAESLVEGRSCGTCNVCCVALTIDDPELKKPQGIRCRNAQRDNSCAIYPVRPATCRAFLCGWRRFRWVREPLRPDLSGVLVREHVVVSEERGETETGVVITLLHARAVEAEGVAETVAAAVAAGLPVFLNIPGPPGYTSGRARIDEALRMAVLTRDKAAVLEVLRRARASGRKGERKRIMMRPS